MLLINEYQDRGCSGLQMTCIKSTLHFGDQIKSKCAISSTLNGVKIIHLSVIFLKMRSWVVSLRAESSGSSRTYNLKTSSMKWESHFLIIIGVLFYGSTAFIAVYISFFLCICFCGNMLLYNMSHLCKWMCRYVSMFSPVFGGHRTTFSQKYHTYFLGNRVSI